MQLSAFITIDYDEGDPFSYRGVVVSTNNDVSQKVEEPQILIDEEILDSISKTLAEKKDNKSKKDSGNKKRFYTGRCKFEEDMKAAKEFAKSIADRVSYSSSVDNFISDWKECDF